MVPDMTRATNDKTQVDAEASSHNSGLLSIIEKITFPISYPMTNWMPTKKLPEFVLLVVLVEFFYITDFLLEVVHVFALRTGVTYLSIGFTIMAWGANAVDLICMSLAFVHGEEQLGFSAVFCA